MFRFNYKMKPYYINLQKIENLDLGSISVFEEIPFEVKRIFWVYENPPLLERGGHASKDKKVCVALNDTIIFNIETRDGAKEKFHIEKNKALFMPELIWLTYEMSPKAILFALSSLKYDEKNYIRNYEDFKLLTYCEYGR